MTDALLATAVAVLLAALALAALGLLTVVPWSVTVGLAERRGLGPVRWGAASAACGVVGTLVAVQALRTGPRPVAALLGVAAAWAAPLALRAAGPGRLAGARGRHE